MGVVLSYLVDERRRYSAVLWVCVQDELVLECNGQIFCPREPTCPEQHISLYSASAQEIEVQIHINTAGSLLLLLLLVFSVQCVCVGAGVLPERGGVRFSEVVGGDSGAGKTDEDV